MCGRFVLASDAKKLAGHFKAVIQPKLFPRFNICPTQPVPVVRQHAGQREIGLVRWGLVPQWADDVAIGQKMIMARSETAAEKPAFRSAMKYRRCLIPADGFYEWTAPLAGRTKQPHYIQLADESPMGLAGLWEHWQDPAGNELETCTILTTPANAMLRTIHPRMPVIIDPVDYARWLDPAIQHADAVTDLLRAFPAEFMMHRPVSTRVNSVQNDDASLLEPEQQTLFG